jgi:cobalt-zinc-cadmium efflux system protein
VRDAVNILLESVPAHINIESVIESITNISGVQAVHDMHIWTITSGVHALSAHLRIDDQTISEGAEILTTVNHILADEYNITHTTLQLECETCPSGFICNVNPANSQH